MSTYVISDIHGQLKIFKDLLTKANFKFDYSDNLYILGDLADWGEEPIKTMLYVKELCEKYNFIKCLLGNHDAMLIDAIINNKTESQVYFSMWGNNCGSITYSEYLQLNTKEKDELYKWLISLPMEFENVKVNGRLYHMVHATPSIDKHNNIDNFDVFADEYWYRMNYFEYPHGLTSDYHTLIYGHTMTKHYLGRDNNIPNMVLCDNIRNKIGIDCGGKAADSYKGYRLALVNLSNMSVMYSDENGWKPLIMNDITKGILRLHNFK